MTTVVVMPGGFHPFHAGHMALYNSARRVFPDAEVYVAATNDTSSRPFPFAIKEKLAGLAGVEPGHFVQVKSPFRAEEITAKFDPNKDQLIFVRSEKDQGTPPQPGGVKKDGSPAYLQPLLGAKKLEPFAKHAYMAYLDTIDFSDILPPWVKEYGDGWESASKIRAVWPQLDNNRKTEFIMGLYPRTQGNPKLAATVVGLLDAAIVGDSVNEGATVTRIDSKPITDFASGLKAYKHTDDWSQSGLDTGDDSYWKNKNLKTKTTKGLFAGDPRRTALYATGNAHETRYVEFTLDGQPIVYFDKKDLPAMRNRKTYLTVFDADNFKQLPTGEWFSENPGRPIKQMPIGDPFKYIADQGWIVRVTDDLDKVFRQVKKMHQAGKIAQYGAEGMNESMHDVEENQGWAATYTNEETRAYGGQQGAGMTAAYQRRENQPVDERKKESETTPAEYRRDPELYKLRQYAKQHYGQYSDDPEMAMMKLLQRGMEHSELNDREHDQKLRALAQQIQAIKAELQQKESADYLEEKWSEKYKRLIDCSNPKGFSQRAHCAGRKK